MAGDELSSIGEVMREVADEQTRPGQVGATTVASRVRAAEVVGASYAQFVNRVQWAGDVFSKVTYWRLGRPELSFGVQPRLKEVA